MAIGITSPYEIATGTAVAPSVTVPEVNDFQKQLNTDLAGVFFNAYEFAEAISVYHQSLNRWKSYNVLFDTPHTTSRLPSDAEFSTIRPQFQISESALVHRILKNDLCTRKGKTYFVEDVESDGVGISVVYLRLK